MAQETQTGALYQPRGVGRGGRWERGSKGRGYMYIYGWFMLRFDRKQQNSVKQLSFNKKYKLKKINYLPLHPFSLPNPWQQMIFFFFLLSPCLVTKSSLTLCSPMNYIVHQAPLSIGFQRQDYWSGYPFPSPGDLFNPGIKPASPA